MFKVEKEQGTGLELPKAVRRTGGIGSFKAGTIDCYCCGILLSIQIKPQQSAFYRPIEQYDAARWTQSDMFGQIGISGQQIG